MGPAIGEALAALALGEATPFDVSQFAVDREALTSQEGRDRPVRRK